MTQLPAPSRGLRRRALLALVGSLIALTSSCQLAQAAVDMPGKVLSGSRPPLAVPPNVVQAGVMRFADTFASQIAQAARDFAAAAGTPAARIQAMNWTVGQSTSAITIATGSNPNANMLDMIVLVTLGRLVHEGHLLPDVWGEADRPMLEAFKKLEEEIWGIARELLSPEQQEAVRTTLVEWCAKNPDMGMTAFVRLPAFKDLLASTAEPGKNVFSDLSSLVSLDPLSGLEPTTREIEQTRLFAERTLFYVQRMPLILPIQAELLGLELSELPAVGAVLDDSERISHAATSLAETAAGLPEAVRVEREAAMQQLSAEREAAVKQLSAEREAAVKQIAEELTLQRQGLLRDLEAAQAPAQLVLSETRATLAAGTEMSSALQGTIQALASLLAGFEKEASASAETAPLPPPTASGEAPKPFDIVDYGEAATHLGTAAGELTRLITTLHQSLPEAQRLVDEVAQRGERTLDHAFVRGVVSGAILIALAALAMLLVRRVSARWATPSRPASKSGS